MDGVMWLPAVLPLATQRSPSFRYRMPVGLRSKSAALRSCNSRAGNSSSQSAQVYHEAECLDLCRRPLVAEDHGYTRDVQLACGLRRRWPSTTSPSLCARTGILKPNSRMLPHMRSTAASFLRGIASVEDQLFDWPLLNARPTVSETIPYLVKIEFVWRILSEGALCAGPSNRASHSNMLPEQFPCRTTTNLAVQHAPNILRPYRAFHTPLRFCKRRSLRRHYWTMPGGCDINRAHALQTHGVSPLGVLQSTPQLHCLPSR
jgi:hypothetical protein